MASLFNWENDTCEGAEQLEEYYKELNEIRDLIKSIPKVMEETHNLQKDIFDYIDIGGN